jgi:hypothetical protein
VDDAFYESYSLLPVFLDVFKVGAILLKTGKIALEMF